MKKAICVLAILFTLLGTAQAQDNGPDTVAIYGGFTNITIPGENFQGINGQLQIKVVRFGNVKIQVAGDYAAFFLENFNNIHTFQGGPRVGIDLADRKVTLYGEMLFGTITTFNDDATYAYSPGGGVDLNITKRVFIRGGYNRQFVRDAGDSFNRITVGGGLRF